MTATPPVIVSHAQIVRAFGGRTEEAVASGGGGLSLDDEAVLGRALTSLEDAEEDPDVLHSPNDQAAALLQTYLAEHALESGRVEEAPFGALEAKFDRTDLLGWAPTAIPHIRAKLGITHRDARPEGPVAVDIIPNQCSIVLLGDWGTGLYGARPAANSIAQRAEHDVLLHLGDVYYSGSSSEIQSRFLDLWEPMAAASPRAISRACNSNHEMYSGGGPYFTKTLSSFGQSSPVFVLQNDHWVLVGLDSAYADHDLDNEQAKLLGQLAAELGGRRLVLFSHHQPYSLRSGQGPKLVRRLRPLLDARQVFAWYWGHEHRLVLYEAHPRWGLRGRCVGHGGMPYRRDRFGGAPRIRLVEEHEFRTLNPSGDKPGAWFLDGPNDYLGDRRDRYGPHGYMRLELFGSELHESLLTPAGTVLWEADLK